MLLITENLWTIFPGDKFTLLGKIVRKFQGLFITPKEDCGQEIWAEDFGQLPTELPSSRFIWA